MGAHDWYRNTSWSDEIEAQFFAKLNRARTQRDQYLAIQAIILAPTYPDVALRLVELYFDTRSNPFDDVQAYWAQAEAHKAKGDADAAVTSYRAILKREEEFPNHRTTTSFVLPYFIASRGLSQHYAYAREVLAQDLNPATFPIDAYMFHAAQALLAGAEGQNAMAKDHAILALEKAEVEKSGFRYHSSVGLVGVEHAATIEALIQIAQPAG